MSTYDPTELDWSGCDVVLECTGKFNDGEPRGAHSTGGQIGADLCHSQTVDKTIVYGVNHRDLIPGTQ